MSKAPRPDVPPVPRPQVPRPKPGPGGPDADPCEGPYEAAFTTSAAAVIGMAVVVPAGNALTLVAGSQLVGRLDGGTAFDRVAACIRAGWAFAGTVTEVAGSKGEVVLGGELTS